MSPHLTALLEEASKPFDDGAIRKEAKSIVNRDNYGASIERARNLKPIGNPFLTTSFIRGAQFQHGRDRKLIERLVLVVREQRSALEKCDCSCELQLEGLTEGAMPFFGKTEIKLCPKHEIDQRIETALLGEREGTT